VSVSLLLVGINESSHVGGHLLAAANEIELNAHFIDLREAWKGPRWWRALCWRFAGHRPPRLRSFSRHILSEQNRLKPDLMLSTGIAPLDEHCLKSLRTTRTTLANFLTDDPWNRQHRAPWFMSALRHYHHIFSPRRANMAELIQASSACVHYLPFAYSPRVHYPVYSLDSSKLSPPSGRALFIGGADQDRRATMSTLACAGVPLELWGGYWQRDPKLRGYAKGHATAEAMRELVPSASVNICLVRKANRDGHSMRSFEVPAMGGCMALEDTTEHREIFGEDKKAACYFKSEAELTQVCRELISTPAEVIRLRNAAHLAVTAESDNTYAARLRKIIHTLG
jgi:spore maturation protein CgeB